MTRAATTPIESERAISSGKWLMAAVVLLPLLFIVVHAIGTAWYPAGDEALLMMRTSETFTDDNSFLGPYSRYGWSHPGPLLFWIYAVGFRVTGGAGWSLLVTAALITAGSAATILYVAWCQGRTMLVGLASIAISIVTVSLGAAVIQRPWNPYVTLFAFGAIIIASWAVRQKPLLLIVTALLGSFLVQTHIGFALMVAVLWAIAVYNAYRARIPRKHLGIAAVVLMICWVPVLGDQIFGTGNTAEIVSFFIGSDEPAVGLSDALGIVARELGGVSPWLGGNEPNDANGSVAQLGTSALVMPVCVFFAGLLVARRRHDTLAFSFQIVVLTTASAGFVSLSRITDGASFYLVRYWWIIAMFWWVSSLWSLSRAIEYRIPERVVAVVVVGVAGTLGIVSVVDTNSTGVPNPRLQSTIAAIVAPTIDELRNERLVFVDERGPTGGWLADAVIAQLELAEIDIAVSQERSFKLPNNVDTAENASAHIVVATGTSVDAALALPGAQLLALSYPDTTAAPDLAPDGDGPDAERTAVIRLR